VVCDSLGNDIRAHRSVPAAIYAFLDESGSYEAAIRRALSFGGDTDTIGSMTGAMAGALHGIESIPREWLEALDAEPGVRERLRTLAIALLELGSALQRTGRPGTPARPWRVTPETGSQ
jgi:ADP-ribosylglycohydrolase